MAKWTAQLRSCSRAHVLVGGVCLCLTLMAFALPRNRPEEVLQVFANSSYADLAFADSANIMRVREMEQRIKQQLPALSCEQRLDVHSTDADSPFAVTGTEQLCDHWSEPPLVVQPSPAAAAADDAANQSISLSFPLTTSQLLAVRALAQPSQLGIGPTEQLNRRLRSSLELLASQLQLSASMQCALHAIQLALIEQLMQRSLPTEVRDDLESWMLRVSPRKLLLYATGDRFVRHRDTYKSEGQLATLLVRLPTQDGFTGGAVKVRRPSRGGGGDTEVVWDVAALPLQGTHAAPARAAVRQPWCACSNATAVPLHYVVFWSDCEHEVTRVKSGDRVVLMLDVIFEQVLSGY